MEPRAFLLLLLLLPPLAAPLPSPVPGAAGAAGPVPGTGTEKAGYCYHLMDTVGFPDTDCQPCHPPGPCPGCTSDDACPGDTKCCPSKCGYTCQEPVLDLCYLPSVCGNCKALFVRFFYNASSQRCEEFIYGGCGGNSNNFESEGECSRACSHIST